MKKLVSILIVLLICSFALCACTPNEDSITKKLEKNNYVVGAINKADLNAYHINKIDEGKLDYTLCAATNGLIVYVVTFNNGDDAKAYYDKLDGKKDKLIAELFSGLKYIVVKKGNAVIFGNKEAVDLI